MIRLNRFEGYKELINNSKFEKQNDKILGICESKGIKFLISTFKYISEEELSDENFKKTIANLRLNNINFFDLEDNRINFGEYCGAYNDTLKTYVFQKLIEEDGEQLVVNYVMRANMIENIFYTKDKIKYRKNGPAEIHFKLSLIRKVIKVEEVFYENGAIVCDPKKIKKRTYEMGIDPTSDYRETIKQYKNNKVKSVVRSESNVFLTNSKYPCKINYDEDGRIFIIMWLKDGVVSRDKFPAKYVFDHQNNWCMMEYKNDGSYHRLDGPAVMIKNFKTGEILESKYYIDDKLYDEFSYLVKIASLKNN